MLDNDSVFTSLREILCGNRLPQFFSRLSKWIQGNCGIRRFDSRSIRFGFARSAEFIQGC